MNTTVRHKLSFLLIALLIGFALVGIVGPGVAVGETVSDGEERPVLDEESAFETVTAAQQAFATDGTTDQTLGPLDDRTVTIELVAQDFEETPTVPRGTPLIYDVNLVGVTDGISSFDIQIDIGSTDAMFTDYSLNKSGWDNSRILDDGMTVSLEVALGDNTYGPAESHTIATVTAEGLEAGTVDLSPRSDASILDENATQYEEITTNNTAFDVTDGLDVNKNGLPATDQSGDGNFDDVTGSQSVGVIDVQAIFEHRYREVITRNADRFEFSNLSDDGRVSIFDVQALFNEL